MNSYARHAFFSHRVARDDLSLAYSYALTPLHHSTRRRSSSPTLTNTVVFAITTLFADTIEFNRPRKPHQAAVRFV